MNSKSDGFKRVKNVSLRYVESMKIGPQPGIYSKEKDGGESFYGSYHASHILDLFDELNKYSDEEIDQWADFFRQRQTQNGFFTSDKNLYDKTLKGRDLDPVWHYTRGNIWALRILNRKPSFNLSFIEPFLSPVYLYNWVKSYDWSNPWAAGNQILACATALFAARDWFGVSVVNEVMEEAMYPALEELLDENTGFWGTQFGAGLPNGLFGTIHITPIYFAQKWPLKAVERNVDSTLKCQLSDGSFWPGGSDCPDFDGAYMLANLNELTNYRAEEMQKSAERLMSHLLMHKDPEGNGWLLHRKNSKPSDWKPRPHFIWKPGVERAIEEQRDDDPERTHIMLGSWFYPLSIVLLTHMLDETGYEGPYKINPQSLHQCNVFNRSN